MQLPYERGQYAQGSFFFQLHKLVLHDRIFPATSVSSKKSELEDKSKY